MKRTIDIIDDQNNRAQFSNLDLPLIVLINNVEGVSIVKATNEDINTEEAIAYIGDDEGYLFLQPSETNYRSDLFHNDEIINKSVWLKSGDKIQINNHYILYSVSGDKTQFKITENNNFNLKKEIPNLSPPPHPIHHDVKDNLLTQTNNLKHQEINNNPSKIKKLLIYIFLATLILTSTFILLAETVSIKSQPDYDSLSINGIFPTFEIDRRFILIDGEYQLNIEKNGYQSIHKKLNINSENNNFIFELDEMPGQIKFELSPEENSQLFIDNELITKGNKDWYEIYGGEHKLTIKNPKYKDFEQVITIDGKDKSQIYEIELEPNWGFLEIISKKEVDLSDIEIQVYSNKEDNIRIDYRKNLELVSGDYTIKINKNKYKELIKIVSIQAGEKVLLEIPELLPKDGLIKLSSQPSKSIIRIDGQYYGKTPQEIKIGSGIVHKIQLSLAGFEDITETIKIEAEENIVKEFKFKNERSSIFISVIPASSELFINNIKQKKSSGKFTLNGNNNNFLVKAEGYVSQSKQIRSEKFTKNINFKLVKKVTKSKDVKTSLTSTKKQKKMNNYNNSIGQKMILVKPALFSIGSKKNEVGRGSNENFHAVKIDYSYYLSETEISNKQFRQYEASHNSGIISGQSLNRNQQPVVNVSWNKAAMFANWMSEKEGYEKYYKKVNNKMIPSKQTESLYGYRLPYEAEWLLAAKGHQKNKYPWLGTYPPKSTVGNFADESAKAYVANVIEAYNDKNAVSSNVGSYGKNSLGFYDLGGNVSEWCQDYYSPGYGISLTGSSKKIITNPKGPSKGTHKVVKDSSWRDASITELRLNYRSYSKKKGKDIGFRLARRAK